MTEIRVNRDMVGGCCVCGDVNGWTENPIVYCDGTHCNVAVHQACYGIEKVPEGSWFCERCKSQERNSRVRCELCPARNGALKHTDSGGWAHVVCALYIPEVRFGNVTTMDPIVLSHVPQDRFGRNCYLCSKRGDSSKMQVGACMECNRQGCRNYFHVTCAQRDGLLCEESGHFDNIKYTGYCDHHIRKLKDNKGIKMMPRVHPSRQSGAPSPSLDKLEPTPELTRNGPTSSAGVAIALGANSHVPISASVQGVEEGGQLTHRVQLTNGSPSSTQGTSNPAAPTHGGFPQVATLPASASPVVPTVPDALATPVSMSTTVAVTTPVPSAVSPLQQMVTNSGRGSAATPNTRHGSSDKGMKRRSTSTAPSAPVAASKQLPSEEMDLLGPGAKKLRKTGKRTVKSLLEQVTPVVADTVSSFHLERERHSAAESPPRDSRLPSVSTPAPSVLPSASPAPAVPTIVQPIPQYQTDFTGVRGPSSVPVSSTPNSISALPGPAALIAELPSVSHTPVATSSAVPGSSTAVNASWVGPPNPFNHTGGTTSGTATDASSQLPSSLEQLLETQWEQGSQFLMEQAQHFDIASLLSCLHQLRQENTRLESHLSGLSTRRDHLLAVNARLSLPLSSQTSPSTSRAIPSDDYSNTSGKAIRSPAYASPAVTSPSNVGLPKPYLQQPTATVSPGSGGRTPGSAASAFAAPSSAKMAKPAVPVDGTSPEKAVFPTSHQYLLDRSNATQQQQLAAFSLYGLSGGVLTADMQLQHQLAAALSSAYGGAFAAPVTKTSSS